MSEIILVKIHRMEEFKAQQIFCGREQCSRKLPAGSPGQSHMHPKREPAFGTFHSEVITKATVTAKRGKDQPQLNENNLTDSFLPSHFSVLNIPEEKELQKKEDGEKSRNQTFLPPNSNSFEPKVLLLMEGRERFKLDIS